MPSKLLEILQLSWFKKICRSFINQTETGNLHSRRVPLWACCEKWSVVTGKNSACIPRRVLTVLALP
ncbi:hypothetical protein OIU78_023318, partial [Salix suchowensis]